MIGGVSFFGTARSRKLQVNPKIGQYQSGLEHSNPSVSTIVTALQKNLGTHAISKVLLKFICTSELVLDVVQKDNHFRRATPIYCLLEKVILELGAGFYRAKQAICVQQCTKQWFKAPRCFESGMNCF